MKVLVSAYACEPGKGSEPEVGLQTVLAAAREHDVWVVTRANNLATLRPFLAAHPDGHRVTAIGLDVPGVLLRAKKRHRAIGQLYYDQWQRVLGRRAAELDRRVGFDVVHHVTFAAYWMRTGVAGLRPPLVWGPVGGGVTTPRRLYDQLGVRGVLEEVGRNVVRPLVTRLPSHAAPQRHAAVVLTQNPETAALLRTRHPARVLPNALAAGVPPDAAPATRSRTVVAVARLVPWKGMRLGLRAFARAGVPDARLVVIGRGVELPRLRRLAAELRIADRVTFTGRMPREELLRVVAGAAALIHPALHEEAGLAVSEALSYGTPVVCLDRGGPPELLDRWPDVPGDAVPPTTADGTVAALADALRRHLLGPGRPVGLTPPDVTYADAVLDAYALAVARS